MRRFVERNLLAVLAGSKSWGQIDPFTGRRHPPCFQPHPRRAAPPGRERSIHLDLEEHAGRLVAGITICAGIRGEERGRGRVNGWLDRLPLEQVRAFTDALAGFYKFCGVDLVREQVQGVAAAGGVVRRPGTRPGRGNGAGPRKGRGVRPPDAKGCLPPQPFDGLAPAQPAHPVGGQAGVCEKADPLGRLGGGVGARRWPARAISRRCCEASRCFPWIRRKSAGRAAAEVSAAPAVTGTRETPAPPR